MNELIQRTLGQGYLTEKEKLIITQTLAAKKAHLTDSVRQLTMELLEDKQALDDVMDVLVQVGDLEVRGKV